MTPALARQYGLHCIKASIPFLGIVYNNVCQVSVALRLIACTSAINGFRPIGVRLCASTEAAFVFWFKRARPHDVACIRVCVSICLSASAARACACAARSQPALPTACSHSAVLQNTFNVFYCETLRDGRSIMASNPSVECWSSDEHAGLVAGSILGLILCVGLEPCESPHPRTRLSARVRARGCVGVCAHVGGPTCAFVGVSARTSVGRRATVRGPLLRAG